MKILGVGIPRYYTALNVLELTKIGKKFTGSIKKMLTIENLQNERFLTIHYNSKLSLKTIERLSLSI